MARLDDPRPTIRVTVSPSPERPWGRERPPEGLAYFKTDVQPAHGPSYHIAYRCEPDTSCTYFAFDGHRTIEWVLHSDGRLSGPAVDVLTLAWASPELEAMSLRYVADVHLAADVRLEALWCAIQRVGRIPPCARPIAYMMSILKYKVLELRDREQRQTRGWILQGDPFEEDELEHPRSSEEPDAPVVRREQELAVREEVARLPAKQREAMELRLSGFSSAEAAARLEISENTFDARLSRGREGLRAPLARRLDFA